MYILHYPPIHHMTITQHFPTISQPFFPTAPGHWSARGRATRRGWRLACLGRRLRSNCQAGDGRRRGNGHERTSKNGRCLWMIIYNYMIFYYMIICLIMIDHDWSWLIMIYPVINKEYVCITYIYIYIYTSLSLVAFCRIWWVNISGKRGNLGWFNRLEEVNPGDATLSAHLDTGQKAPRRVCLWWFVNIIEHVTPIIINSSYIYGLLW